MKHLLRVHSKTSYATLIVMESLCKIWEGFIRKYFGTYLTPSVIDELDIERELTMLRVQPQKRNRRSPCYPLADVILTRSIKYGTPLQFMRIYCINYYHMCEKRLDRLRRQLMSGTVHFSVLQHQLQRFIQGR